MAVASGCCGGTSHFFRKSQVCSAALGAVAVENLLFSGEQTLAKSEQAGAELFVEKGFVERGNCEVSQRQRDVLVQKLRTEAKKSLIAVIAKNGASGDGKNTGHLTVLYVIEQPVLLNVLDELSNNDVVGVRQGAFLNVEATSAEAGDCEEKNKEEFSDGQSLIERLRDGYQVVLVTEVPSFVDHNGTRPPLRRCA